MSLADVLITILQVFTAIILAVGTGQFVSAIVKPYLPESKLDKLSRRMKELDQDIAKFEKTTY